MVETLTFRLEFIRARRRGHLRKRIKEANLASCTEFIQNTFSGLPSQSDVIISERTFRCIVTSAFVRFGSSSCGIGGDSLADPGNPLISELSVRIRFQANQHMNGKEISLSSRKATSDDVIFHKGRY